MPAPIRMVLNAEEDRTLLELSCADGIPHRTTQRASSSGIQSVNVVLKPLFRDTSYPSDSSSRGFVSPQ